METTGPPILPTKRAACQPAILCTQARMPVLAPAAADLQAHREDLLDVLRAQRLEGMHSALGDRLLRHDGEVRVVNTNLGERTLESERLEQESANALDSLLCNLHLGKRSIYIKNVDPELVELGDGRLIERVFHPSGGENRKAQSVGDVVNGRQLVLHRVAAPRLALATVDEAVDGPGGGPHQVCTSLVVVRLLHGYGSIPDDGSHQHFHEAVKHLQVLVHVEVDLDDVGQDVGRATGSLIGADRVGIRGIEEGYLRLHRRKQQANLVMCLGIADDAPAVHLRTRGSKGKNRDHRQALLHGRLLEQDVPCVTIVVCCRTDVLRAVDHRTATNGQENVDVLPPADVRTCIDGGHTGIRVDTAKLEQLEPRLLHLRDDLVVQAAPLDRAAAIDQKDSLAEASKLRSEIAELIRSEIDLRGNVIDEVVQRHAPLPSRDPMPWHQVYKLK